MKYRLLDLLQPISETSNLNVIAKLVKKVSFTDNLDKVKCTRYCGFRNCMVEPGTVSPADCNECYTNEIVDGELVAESGKRYLIVNGIPRMFSGAMSNFLQKNKATFSLEWKMFQFGERNWGQDIEFRKQLFLKGMGLNKESLKNKLIFDAGCGSGLLSISMADDFGMEVLALDLGMGIEKAYEHNTNPYVYFVQGSILDSPVQNNVADLVYCAGVLIHLPDTKIGFQALPRILKEGGRYFIWVYHPIDKQHHPNDLFKMKCYNWIRDNITSPLPIKIQYLIYLVWTVLFIIKQNIFNTFQVTRDDRTWREKMQDFVDMFSPIYQHRHTEQEVMAWYREIGFMNENISYQEKYGFGARGDKRLQANAVMHDSDQQ